MKKTVLSIAAAALVSSALFTGCGSDSATPAIAVTTSAIGTGPALSIGQTITKSAKGYQTVSGGLLDLDGDVATTNDIFVFGNLVMQAPANYSVITPITDLVVSQVEAGLTLANAEAAVAAALGLNTTDLMYTSETAKTAGLSTDTQAKLLAINSTLLAEFANTTTRAVRAESIPNPFAPTTTTSSSSVASSTSAAASSSTEAIPNPFAPASSAPAASSSAPAASSSAPAASSSAPAASSSSVAFDVDAVANTILAKLSATFKTKTETARASIATSLAGGKSFKQIAFDLVTSIFSGISNVVSKDKLTGTNAAAYAAAIAGHSSSSTPAASSSSTPAASSSSTPAASSSSTPAASSSSAPAESIPNPFG